MLCGQGSYPCLVADVFKPAVRYTGVSLVLQGSRLFGIGLLPVLSSRILADGGGGGGGGGGPPTWTPLLGERGRLYPADSVLLLVAGAAVIAVLSVRMIRFYMPTFRWKSSKIRNCVGRGDSAWGRGGEFKEPEDEYLEDGDEGFLYDDDSDWDSDSESGDDDEEEEEEEEEEEAAHSDWSLGLWAKVPVGWDPGADEKMEERAEGARVVALSPERRGQGRMVMPPLMMPSHTASGRVVDVEEGKSPGRCPRVRL
jgi:hypothetical protein